MTEVDLGKFNKSISQIEIQLDKATVETIKKVTLVIDSALVLSTPVDTGRARANWLPSINSPRTEKIKDKTDISGVKSIEEANSVVSNVKPGDTVYIRNNLEYIQRLNNGHSKQAPAGFVEKAVQSVKGI